jgi:predicted DCC family thiol-disulfide oxidoreductase YuxK
MKTALTLFSLAFLTLTAVVVAETQQPAPVPAVEAAPTDAALAAAAPDRAAEAALARIFSGQRPVNRSVSCYETMIQYCQDFCYGLVMENRCDFFANQECLCERSPADCPICY